MRRVAQSERHHEPGLRDEPVPGFTALVEDVGIGSEDPIAEPVVAHELPQILDWVELGRAGWQGQQ
jgi:hypothetical protein